MLRGKTHFKKFKRKYLEHLSNDEITFLKQFLTFKKKAEIKACVILKELIISNMTNNYNTSFYRFWFYFREGFSCPKVLSTPK